MMNHNTVTAAATGARSIDAMRANRAKQQAAQEAEQAGLMAAQAKDAGQPTTAAGMAAAGGARLRLASG